MKKLIALLLTVSLPMGCKPTPAGNDSHGPNFSVPLPPGCHDAAWGPLQTVYHETFPKGALDSGYTDSIHDTPQPLKFGDAGPAAQGTYGEAPAADGALSLTVTAPHDIPAGQTPSAGVFSIRLPFGLRSIFVARATFQNLDGKIFPAASPDITNAWAVGIAARTGDEQDLATETRMGLTFRVTDQANALAKLSVQDSGAASALHKEDVREDIATNIFGKKQPFTLELSVNRQTCMGTGTLTTADAKPQTFSFRLHSFLANSGETITAVGPILANCCAPKGRVYAEVSDFQILVPLHGRGSATEPNVPNPPPINPH